MVAECGSRVVVAKACRFLSADTGCVCETAITCANSSSTTTPPLPTSDPAAYPDEQTCLTHLQQNKGTHYSPIAEQHGEQSGIWLVTRCSF